MLRAELEGEPVPELVTQNTSVEFRAGIYVVRFGDAETDRGTYSLEEINELTLHGSSGVNAGRTIPCLYQTKGDRLRVCYGLDSVRPTEFTTAANTGRYLGWYRRPSAQPSR